MTNGSVDKYNKTLPSRIRDALDKKKMKRQELAVKTGFSRQRIGYYADGTNIPDAEALAKIAKALEVSADYLLGLDEDETQKIETYADVANILDCIVNLNKDWNIEPGMIEGDPEFHEEDEYQLIINLGKDRTLFDYYVAIEKMVEALKTVPSDTAKQLLQPFMDDLKAKTLNEPILLF